MAAIHDHTNVNIAFVIPLIAFIVVLIYGLVGHRWIRYVDEPILNPTSIVDRGFDDNDILKKDHISQTENIDKH